MANLIDQRCQPCEGGTPSLTAPQAEQLLREVPGWSLDPGGKAISRSYGFKNFYQTIAFVNAVAWVANQQDHHPELEVSYKNCRVRYSTHAIGGLSQNDFICAARINQLLGGP